MSLRMVELVVPNSVEKELDSLSEDLEIIGAWHESSHHDLMLLRILVHSQRTEAVIEQLQTRFQSHADFRLFIYEIEATVPVPELEQTPEDKSQPQGTSGEVDQDESKENDRDPQRIACAELVQKLSGGALVTRIYLLTVILSTVVAAIGLMRDNVAVIIGAMVIAPLLQPNMTLTLATTLGDLKLARNALWVNASGLILALLVSAIIGLLIAVDPDAPQIRDRIQVGLSDVALALAAGSAGALAFTSGLSSAVVGVMVAVALLPPLVASGLLLGAGLWSAAAGSLLLTLTNIICINLAGVLTFLFQDVRPGHWWEAERARRMVRLAAATWLILLAILILLIQIAYR